MRVAAALANADRLLPEFRAIINTMPAQERGPGIYLSEMFLFYCVVRPLAPARILESGRDIGGSPCLLANCFPDAHIISVEFDRESPRAALALERLRPHRHVECLFGDSRELLPKFLQPGDPVLIDGPKEFRALKLALRLLRTGKPSVVFVHDLPAGSPARQFVDRHWPGAFFSDHPDFFARFCTLDDAGPEPRITTFGCLPPKLPAPYCYLMARLVLARTISLASEKLSRLSGRLSAS